MKPIGENHGREPNVAQIRKVGRARVHKSLNGRGGAEANPLKIVCPRRVGSFGKREGAGAANGSGAWRRGWTSP